MVAVAVEDHMVLMDQAVDQLDQVEVVQEPLQELVP
tara:strand:+ start:246 stop:353 length:108 start_codon:yes stop_codon:yes gene_type:complete